MASDDDDVMREFLIESRDNLNQLDRDLVALEQNPRDPKLLGAIFRCVHTIKGTAGFLGLVKLESLTHVGESQLSRLRDGGLSLDTELTSKLLAMVDAIRRILASLEANGSEGGEDFSNVVHELSQVGAGSTPRAAAASTRASVTPELLPRAAPAHAPAAPVAPDAPLAAPAEALGKAAAGVADTAIRVDVALLDRVMNLVGELVLARNQIIQYGLSSKDAGFVNASQRLNLLTTELQAGVMKTRMQPIGNVWNRFPRIVRDLANVCGKQVTLELDGTETELDRSIIEAIKDPLTHAVRNAVDHGIETQAARLAAGKSATGHLLLRAYHEGGQVNIEVSDDGGGLPVEKIRARAVERGVVTAERAARMSEREVAHLIFLPGFSTAEQVTNVSGRGVGMDVVKTNIEKIGGTVDISSRVGVGTTLKIKIPLTLAIIPALVVTTEGDRFAIPQVSLLELVRLEGDEARKQIEMVYGAPVCRLRGRLLPLVSLAQSLGLQADFRGPGGRGEAVNIVVLQADEHTFGLVVDEINDTEEIVVKPLGKQVKGLNAYAGATIMGDGRVALILDVLGLAQRAKVVSEARAGAQAERTNETRSAAGDTRQMLLLFRLGADRRMAIPLSLVARLEEFKRESVERAGEHQVVQYRGRLLPLLRLTDLLGEPGTASEAETLQVVVYTHEGQDVGLVVENIVDIVEEQLTIHRRQRAGAVYGTAVIQEKVTDMLDVHALIAHADVLLYAGTAELAGAGA